MGIRSNGERCRARPSHGYDFCSFHREDLQDAFRAGRVVGGRRGRFAMTPLDQAQAITVALNLDSRGGVQGMVDTTLRQLFLGAVSPAYAGAVARLLSLALRNLDRTHPEAEDHTLENYLPNISHMLEFEKVMIPSSSEPEPTHLDEDFLQALAALTD